MDKIIAKILSLLPYGESFRFVEGISRIDTEGVEGYYRFPEQSWYYQGHFKGHPVTPGVILCEVCAQIGLVCLGIYLMEISGKGFGHNSRIAFTESHMDFLKAVYPGERVRVVSEKEYFRFGKLKCSLQMYNAKDELVCKGYMAGMLLDKANG